MSDTNNKNYLLVYCGITSLASIYYYIKYKNLLYTNTQYKKYITMNPQQLLLNLNTFYE